MANNTIQFKRTSTTGLLPNTTNAANNAYIPAGSFAVNLTDKRVHSSDGSLPFEVGANVTNQIVTGNVVLTNNNVRLSFATVNTAANSYFIQQNDDNFVFYSTNTAYGQRPVWSIFANSITSNLNISVRTQLGGGAYFPPSATIVDSTGSQGTAGQVLTSNGAGNVYWSTVSSGGGGVNSAAQYTWSNTQTFQANVTFGNSISLTTGNSTASGGLLYFNGLADANWKMGRNTASVTKWIYTNNTIDIVVANSNLEGFVIGLSNTIGQQSYFETGHRGTYINANVTIGNSTSNSYITSTLATLAGNLNVGSASTNNQTQILSNSQINPSGSVSSNAYLYMSGAGGNYLAFGQSTAFSQWIQAGFNGSSIYYPINLNPLGGNVSIGSITTPTATLTVNGTANVSTSVNSAAFTVGTSFIANSTGITGTLLTVSQPNITANNSTNLNGLAATAYVSNSALTTLAYTFTGLHTYNANLTFGSSTRILGDFTNATVNNRTIFQTSTLNSSTGIYAFPNGTSGAASWQAANSSDGTNASKILIATNGATDVQLVSGINGTGTYLPLTFYNNGSEQMRLAVNGNFGIGNTAPADKLSVNGTTYFGGVTTHAANASVVGNFTVTATSTTVPGVSVVNNSVGVFTLPNAGASAYNNLVAAGDNLIYFSNNSTNNGNLVIGTWTDRTAGFGMKFTGNSATVAVTANAFNVTGNTTITGFANVTTSIQGGSSLTIAGALSGVTTLAAGNTTITGFANVTTSVNSAALSVGTSFVANTTQVTIAGVPLSANGGVGTAAQVLTSNGATGSPYWSTVSSGTTYTFSTGLINTTGTITVNSAYIATISANNASFLGGTAAASYALLSGGTFTGTITSSNGTGFIHSSASGVSLQMAESSAIRNVGAAGGTMYFDCATGGATAGSFIFRVTSSFTTITTINGSGTQTTSLGVGTAPSGTAGEIRATNNITSYYSDERLKENITPISNALEKVRKISGVTFNSNDTAAEFGYTDKKTQVGVIAQEIEAVLPEIVVPAPFDIGQDADGNEYSLSGENYKTVQYDKLIPLLIEAIKEQQNQIDELRKQVNDAASK
jgi:Chaperone of endosialidase